MSGRNKAARILVAIGSVVLFASAGLHSLAAYPTVSTALGASNLSARLQGPLRAVFLMVGWDWIAIGIVALLAVFTETGLRKILVLLCAVAVLGETAITLAYIGVFLGNEMIGSATVLLLVGGLLVQNAPPNHEPGWACGAAS